MSSQRTSGGERGIMKPMRRGRLRKKTNVKRGRKISSQGELPMSGERSERKEKR